MIIHKLEMYNFRQYIGHQEVSFSTDSKKNVTVLIGVNTSGKTTIVRAFEWCLYAKNGFEDQVLLNSNVRDNMNVGDTQEVWVAVTFSHADSNGEKTYTLKRKYTYLCNERTNAEGRLFVGLNKKPDEDLSLTYLQFDGQTKTAIRRENIAESIDRVLPKILSIHSRRAVKEVLQILGKYTGDFVPVLHWFTGSVKEAEKAIELGCWFSVNPNMCFTDSGKKVISCIPLDRVLPETDAPFTQKDGVPYMPWDTTVTTYIAKENNMTFDDMNGLLHRNLKSLINIR